jgi:hypothetical protein
MDPKKKNSSRLPIASHHVPQVGLGLEGLAADLTADILLCLVDGVLVAQEAARRGQDGAANVARSVALEAWTHATMHLKRKGGMVNIVAIRDVYPGSQIPDPTFFQPGSRIRTVSIPDPASASKNLSILTQKNGF